MKLLIVCALIGAAYAVVAPSNLDKEGLRDVVLNSVKDAMDPHMKSDMSQYTHDDHHQVAKDLHDHLYQMAKSMSPVLTEEDKRSCSYIKKPKVVRISSRAILAKAARGVCKGKNAEKKNCRKFAKAVYSFKKKVQKGRKGRKGMVEVDSTDSAAEVLDNHCSKLKPSRMLDRFGRECERYMIEMEDKKKKGLVEEFTEEELKTEYGKAANNLKKFYECSCKKRLGVVYFDKKAKCSKYASKGSNGFVNSLNKISAKLSYTMAKNKCNPFGLVEAQEKEKAGKMGIFFDSATKNFILAITFPSVSCEVQWSPWSPAAAGGQCTLWQILTVKITINAKKKYIKVTVEAGNPAIAAMETALRKIPGLGKKLDQEGIRNGAIYLGHGVYDWGYQNLELATREFCMSLSIFKACAKFEFHARIKGGGLYKGAWGTKDIKSKKCTRGCGHGDIKAGSWVYEDFDFGDMGSPKGSLKKQAKKAFKSAAKTAAKDALRAAGLRARRNFGRRRPSRRRPSRRRPYRRRFGFDEHTTAKNCQCRPWIRLKIVANVKFLGVAVMCTQWKRSVGLVQAENRGWLKGAFRSVGRFARRAVKVVKKAAKVVAKVAVKVWNAVKPTWCKIYEKDVIDKYF